MTADQSQKGDRQPKNVENKRKRRRKRGRPRKSEQTSVDLEPSQPKKKQTPKDKEKTAVLQEKTRLSQVVRFRLAGYSTEEIAEQLEITEKTVNNITASAYAKLDEEVVGLVQNWRTVSLARTEIMMRKLMDKVTDPEYIEIESKDVSMMQKLITMQSKIMGNDAIPTNAIQNNIFVPQMPGDSPAYQYATAQIQHEAVGETMDGLEDMVVTEDSPQSKLDGLLD